MCSSDLRNWPILRLLDSKFISEIHMVVVYGNLSSLSAVIHFFSQSDNIILDNIIVDNINVYYCVVEHKEEKGFPP